MAKKKQKTRRQRRKKLARASKGREAVRSQAKLVAHSLFSHSDEIAPPQSKGRRITRAKPLRWLRFRLRKESTQNFPGLLRLMRYAAVAGALATVVLAALMIRKELLNSNIQSAYLSALAAELTFSVEDGPSNLIRFPESGPYNQRLGYSHIPKFARSLRKKGYVVARQAKLSPRHDELIERGIFPIYDAKTQTGLTILDRKGQELFATSYPERVYQHFSDIPRLVLDTLLYIEDRNILDVSRPNHNPAVEWDRFGKAVLDLGMKFVDSSRHVQGGSTLATQMEKYRYSSEGITGSPVDKLRQMASASLRAYRNGPSTLETRKEIALSYINSVPLAALPRYGEVNGLGDGLWAYFGRDFDQFNSLLRSPVTPQSVAEQAAAYREMLSLFLAHRRPSQYLNEEPQYLKSQVERYLPILYRDGVLSEELYNEAIKIDTTYRRSLPKPPRMSYLDRKGANAIRSNLLQILDLERLYDLDRIDLFAETTVDKQTQQEVTKVLDKLRERDFVKSSALEGFRLLDGNGDPSKVIYSLTLYERVGGANVLRVQTDNLDQPFNISQGVKLDLGSTAKLRTLVTYLDVVSTIYDQFASASKEDLVKAKEQHTDPISLWALDYLAGSDNRSLKPMLQAAMQRTYSANPHESFFTGGGVMTFENFNNQDNGRVMTVQEALRHSVNLPFVRLMRDIVRYYALHISGSSLKTISNLEEESRRELLSKFADREGQEFIRRFYKKYANKKPEEILTILLEGVDHSPKRFSPVFWILNPKADEDEFSRFLRQNFPDQEISDAVVHSLFETYSVRAQTLTDRGYLARIHPLELWVAGYLYANPKADLKAMFDASVAERQEVYHWLFSSRLKRAQDSRIRMVVEQEAFSEIHRQWQKMGYPLRSLVPSLATALGSSADRPDALAELMGIIVNDGQRLPRTRINSLVFAEGTPFETVFRFKPKKGQQVIKKEVAEVVREGLAEVVRSGTAVRIKAGLGNKECRLMVGGKTGTGDHRFEVYGPGGVVRESRVVNRTATFAFFIGERFFGTLTAFVSGSEAAKFKFTSALPVQLLKNLEPALAPMLVENGCSAPDVANS